MYPSFFAFKFELFVFVTCPMTIPIFRGFMSCFVSCDLWPREWQVSTGSFAKVTLGSKFSRPVGAAAGTDILILVQCAALNKNGGISKCKAEEIHANMKHEPKLTCFQVSEASGAEKKNQHAFLKPTAS